MSEGATTHDLDDFQLQDFSEDYRLRALFKMIPKNISWDVLDLGSGNGLLGQMMEGEFGSITLSDYSPKIVEELKKRFGNTKTVKAIKLNAESFELGQKVDLITATDLIEHLENNSGCLKSCFKSLKPGGTVFISVPAMPSLYGSRDRRYGHFRRYNKKGLRRKLQEAGFNIRQIKYWNVTAVLPYLISEKIMKKGLVGPSRSINSSKDRFMNSLLYNILNIESKIPFLPFGLSLIAIAVKNNE